jgi:hypothetical protein
MQEGVPRRGAELGEKKGNEKCKTENEKCGNGETQGLRSL